MDTDTPTVASELYAEKDYLTNSQPTFHKNNVVSKFYFKFPPSSPAIDSDGDLVVERKKHSVQGCIEIEHSKRTILDLVGLQVWRGALLLADWIMHNATLFSNVGKILELGSGVGLTSIVASIYAPVICTDVDKGGILELIQCNLQRNQKYTKYPVTTMGLDFTQSLSTQIETAMPEITTILAADGKISIYIFCPFIYDDDITDAFVNTLQRFLAKPPSRTVYIALEKRYVFTIDDLSSAAPCYEYFLKRFDKLRNITGIMFENIPTDFQQYFDYDRVKQLVLWKISSNYK